jgi:branched-chain amino acid transport system substrate-binding protein
VISDFGAATDDALTFVERGIALSHASAGPVIRVAPGNPDLAGVAAALRAGDSDGVVGFVSGGHEGQLIQQLRAAGLSARYVTQAPFGHTPLASDVSYSTGGALAVAEFALPSSQAAGIQEYRRDLIAYRGMPSSQGAIDFWLAAWVFGRVASGLPTIDAAAVLTAMSNLENLDMGGVTPPLTTVNLAPGSPRLFNSSVTFNRIRDGELMPLSSGFFDPFSARNT